jgi:DNA-binding GntR family transcriptional regulator
MSPDVKARLAEASRPKSELIIRGDGRNRVVEQIRQWIFEGSLSDGDVISQADVAELLGVSRIPVRDGLIALASSGWVIIEPGIGARAVGLDAASVRDNFELFGSIWSLLVRRAVERGDSTVDLELAGTLVKEARSPEEMLLANARFVDSLRLLAAAPRLDAAYRNASRIVPGDFFAIVPNAVETQQTYVPKISSAISKGNIDRGAKMAVALHHVHARSVGRLLADRGVLS